jgi:hypothetical protein
MRAPNPALTGTTSVCHTRTCSASKFAQCSSSTASPANAPTWVHTVALYAPGAVTLHSVCTAICGPTTLLASRVGVSLPRRTNGSASAADPVAEGAARLRSLCVQRRLAR